MCIRDRNKSISKFKLKNIGQKEYPYTDERGDFYIVPLQDNGPHGTKTARPNLFYPIYYNKSTDIFSLDEKKGDIVFVPKKHKNDDGTWMWSKAKFIKDSRDLYLKNDQIYIKHYYDENEDQNRYQRNKSFLDEFQNTTGTKILNTLFENNGIFDNPKPIKLLEWCLNLSVDKDSIILDFFSGSATTAHSVMQLNAEDGGNRKYIMVQLPETTDEKSEAFKAGYKNIAEIGKERIRRAGEKIKQEIEEYNSNLKLGEEPKKVPDIGFKVFKVDDTNIKWYDMENFNEESQYSFDDPDSLDFVLGSNDIDIVYEIMLRQNDVPLSESLEVLTDIGNRTYFYASTYLICLETEITEEMVEKLASLDPLPIKFVFRDSAFKDNISLKDETFRKLRSLIERNSGESKVSYRVEFI